MARLSKSLAGLATKLVHERHQDEAKVEAHQLLNVLNHDHRQNRLALRLAEAGLTMEAAQ